MRVVLDANVFLSGIPRLRDQDTPPRKIIGVWLSGEIDVVISEHIIEEVSRNLRKPWFTARLEGTNAAQVWDEIRLVVEVVELHPEMAIPRLASHPEDDFVLATALQGRVEYLVTGDKQLQKLAIIGEARIVSPADMLRILQERR